MSIVATLKSGSTFIVRQRKELAELFGYESRNKYEILAQDGQVMGFAAEQQKGLAGMLLRQFLGHWRRFDIQFFTADRQPLMRAHHPFRFMFQRLEVFDQDGRLQGSLQQRFALLSKSFDIEDSSGRVLMETRSPLWKPWTFAFASNGREVAIVKKKWSGLLTEVITDADNFVLQISDPTLSVAHRLLLLAAAVFIDLQYFERKANSSS